ncbi:MAG: cytochrome c biogenesis protein CcsA [Candidatus Kapaibacterium sp.]|jgi:cytochrome c-type biogenesis protein CcmF
MVGSVAMAVMFAAILAGIVLYTLVARGRGELLTAARLVTHLAIISIFVAAGTLLYYIFNYHFEINYVYEHVSRSLSKPLLFSTFYASQEGSFMLWALWSAIIAIFLMPYAARQRYEPQVMAVFLAVLGFLALMLIAKSPFQSIYAAHPGEVPTGFIPKDGKGLNPSLENLWIVIHPPMLFLGFSLLAVPFSFAIAGLIKRDYQGWIATSMPWTLGAGMVLGFGIMLGGFWAYETLGWGGYWGWDPVENSSLLPWLVTVAAVHTMLTQRRTGGLVRTNIAMTLLAYALVLYSSFLTRSGILGDASVHSFADPGNLAFNLLLGALILFVGSSFVMFFVRWREMTTLGTEYKLMSRETSLSIAAALLGASTLVVFIGTSSPLVSTKVDNNFYNNLHIPIAIALMVINGLSLLLKWKQTNTKEMLKRATQSLILTGIGTIAFFLLGLRKPELLAMAAGSLFALFVNAEIGYRIFKGHFRVKFQGGVVQQGEYGKRIRTALFLVISISVLALLISTAGDYNLFEAAIVGALPYFFITLAVVIGLFVTVGFPRFDYDTRFIGPYVAHMGVAIFLLGVIATAGYSEKEMVTLPQGTPTKAFGGKYTLTYMGAQESPPERTNWIIQVANDKGIVGVARPLWYMTDFNQHTDPIINPSILKYAARDLYFTTIGYDHTGGVPKDTMSKGQSITVFNGAASLKFIDFDFPQEEKAKMFGGQAFRVRASVEVTDLRTKDAKPIPLQLSVTRNLKSNEAKEEDITVPGTTYHLQLAELKPDMSNPANSKVVIRYFDKSIPQPKQTEVIFVDAFIKPYINLVWAGILTLVAGFGFSTLRRKREAMVSIEKAEAAYAKLLEVRAPNVGTQKPIASADRRTDKQIPRKKQRT